MNIYKLSGNFSKKFLTIFRERIIKIYDITWYARILYENYDLNVFLEKDFIQSYFQLLYYNNIGPITENMTYRTLLEPFNKYYNIINNMSPGMSLEDNIRADIIYCQLYLTLRKFGHATTKTLPPGKYELLPHFDISTFCKWRIFLGENTSVCCVFMSKIYEHNVKHILPLMHIFYITFILCCPVKLPYPILRQIVDGSFNDQLVDLFST